MASESSSRFARRKQLNPRRKNADPESMGPDEGPLSHSVSAGEDEETMEESEDRLVIDSGSPASPKATTDLQPPPRNGFHRLVPSSSPSSSDLGVGSAPSSPSSPPPRHNGQLNLSEAEKIREYMGRSDTAVIFPEPVDIAEPKREQAERPTPPPPGLHPPPHPCPTCAAPLASEAELADHCRRLHPPPPREGAAEATPDSAAQERLHVCSKCKAAFSQRAHLERHQAGHTANATTPNNTNNQRHMLSHDESSVLRKFKCPECGKAFKFKHHLKEHIRIHSGEKPFACPNCGKRFSHSGSYSSHMTSKKCLVVNLKVRKIDVKSSRNRPPAPPPGNGLALSNSNNNTSTNNNAFRPIIPKYGASPEPSYLSDRFPFPVSGEAQSLQPFLPAYASVNFHTLLASHFQGLPPYVPFPGFPEMASLLQQGLHASPCKDDPLPYPGRTVSPPPALPPKDAEDQKPLGSALNAVKKILQIVDATVSKQRLGGRPSHSPLPPSPVERSPPVEVKEEERAIPSRCRFCDEPFESNVNLHQHERYLCKLNRDRPAAKEEGEEESEGMEMHNGHWTPQPAEPNGQPQSSPPPVEDVKPSTEDLKVLLSSNPRPKKGELLKASREMGYPMKAIQGWFRRRPHDRTPSPPPAPPIQVPVYKPYASLCGVPPSAHLGCPSPGKSPSPTPSAPDQPLDLSVKGKATAPLSPFTADGALNLSHKSSRLGLLEEEERRWSSPLVLPRTAPADSLADTLALRLQRNGFLLGSGLRGRSSLSPADSESHSTSDSVRGDFPPEFHPKYLHGNLALGSGGGPLVVQRSPDRFPYPEEARPGSSSDPASCSPSPDGCLPHTDLLMHGKAPFLAGDYDDAEQRRIFKKLWKQDELDESGMGSLGVGCEDVSSGDLLDDLQAAKRRKNSWKASPLHQSGAVLPGVGGCKLEGDEGVFSCDQCDKTFSKQSSLARHKYEHSGQRPHKCDVCSKAFKHKHHLTEHKRLHSGEKPFQCQKCLKRFSHSGSYSQHMNHRYSYCKPYRE